MKKFILTALAALAAFSAGAKVELTPLFTDNMVFQQNTQAPPQAVPQHTHILPVHR